MQSTAIFLVLFLFNGGPLCISARITPLYWMIHIGYDGVRPAVFYHQSFFCYALVALVNLVFYSLLDSFDVSQGVRQIRS